MRKKTWRVAPAEAGWTLEAFLVRKRAAGAKEVPTLLERGAVYLDGRRWTTATRALAVGQVVLVVLEERGMSALEPPRPVDPLQILFEDDDLLALAKAPGTPAQATAGRVGESLLDRASEYLGRTAGLVHRLDRETSGVTLFGKRPSATTALAAKFRAGQVRKRYLAVAATGMGAGGTIDLPISKDPSHPGRYRASRSANGLPARTDFVRLFEGADHALVALFPFSGRTHQIRAHLAALGSPIAGDALYGGPTALATGPVTRCLLHAHAVALEHPRSQSALYVEAPVPEDLAIFFARANVTIPHGSW